MRRKLSAKGLVIIGLLLLGGLFPILGRSQLMKAETVVNQTYSQNQFLQDIAPHAQRLSQVYGVPASLIMAQAALSSNYGSYVLAVTYHNLFGLVAQPGQTSVELRTDRYLAGKLTTISQRFVVYRSWKESLYDYMAKLKSGAWGKDLYQTLATSSDYKISAKALEAAGFSTAPDYAEELINIIEAKNLTQYDN
ncbi:glycoside hydrolase family 73 protein [Streptococcus cuniculipharyngis]|uniref:N-acetyl-muramidase n=1 Tax=Streptococcus cuniculipharyngis TaxID=1562651 RepID=A0A5C5S823_9STRE|nr:glucosaminidase domain-containing protein [Streptococcus cuniculipharyngis]TWS96287.1 N-acetyl-muramidase [Streptococcus cuniculipharyngis]